MNNGDAFETISALRRTIVVTGVASGIGLATVDRLQSMNCRIISADLAGADINVDLGTTEGRAAFTAAVGHLSEGSVDGVVAVAGIGTAPDAASIVSVNYFGAVATTEGLRAMMAATDPANAVVVASTAALLETSPAIISACLAGDEVAARVAARAEPMLAYSSSKAALALWVRRTAIRPEWAGAGLCLNAVGPGGVVTPMTASFLATEEGREIMARTTPRATANYAKPTALAEMLAFLATMRGGYVVGQVIFVDGGTDAILRPTAL